MPSNVHFSSERNDWGTPWPFFYRLKKEFPFTLDVCATRENTKCKAFYPPERDALTKRWHTIVGPENWAWMNPPYGRGIDAWVEKACTESRYGLNIVCLLPARLDTKWFHNHVFGKAAEIRLIQGRLKFDGHENSAPFPSMLAIYCDTLAIESGAGETCWTRMLANPPHRVYSMPAYYAMPRRLRIRQRGNRHDHSEEGE